MNFISCLAFGWLIGKTNQIEENTRPIIKQQALPVNNYKIQIDEVERIINSKAYNDIIFDKDSNIVGKMSENV